MSHQHHLCLSFVIASRSMVWYGMVYVDLYSAVVTTVFDTLCTLVPGEKPLYLFCFVLYL